MTRQICVRHNWARKTLSYAKHPGWLTVLTLAPTSISLHAVIQITLHVGGVSILSTSFHLLFRSEMRNSGFKNKCLQVGNINGLLFNLNGLLLSKWFFEHRVGRHKWQHICFYWHFSPQTMSVCAAPTRQMRLREEFYRTPTDAFDLSRCYRTPVMQQLQ